MKWRIRRMVDRCILFLVGIKPIRWFIDQLLGFGKSNPWFIQLGKWYIKSFKPFWFAYLGYCLLFDIWHRIPYNVFIDAICIIIVIICPNIDGNHDKDNDDDDPNDPDPSPTGDSVDQWLREQQRTLV